MKILIVSPTLPAPISGGRTRLYNLIKQLSQRHEISVITFLQPADNEYLQLLESHCQELELVPIENIAPIGKWRNRAIGWAQILFSARPRYAHTFPVSEMRDPLRRVMQANHYDLVVFEELYLVQLKSEIDDTPAILIEQNVESDIAERRWRQASNPIHKIRDWLNWQKLESYERYWLGQFATLVAVSEIDATKIRSLAPLSSVFVVPNGVDSQAFKADKNRRKSNTVLFFGNLSYEPNVDAILWFCKDIWPEVLKSLPGVKLELVGLRPESRIVDLANLPGVQLSGFVPDIRQKLWSATICIAPIRIGGGTRLKILEALAAHCPAVSTTVGAEGLAVEAGRHLIIADTPKEFSGGVIALLESEELRQKLSHSGRQLVEREYDWKVIAPHLEAACQQAIDASRKL